MPANEVVNREQKLEEFLSKLNVISKILEEIFDVDRYPHLNTLEKQKRNLLEHAIALENMIIIDITIDRMMIQHRQDLIKDAEEREEVKNKYFKSQEKINEITIQELLIEKLKIVKFLKEIDKLLETILEVRKELKNIILSSLTNILDNSNPIIKYPGVDAEINFNGVIEYLKVALPEIIDSNSFRAKNLGQEMLKAISDYIDNKHHNLNDNDKNKVVNDLYNFIKEKLKQNPAYSKMVEIEKAAIKAEDMFVKATSLFKNKVNKLSHGLGFSNEITADLNKFEKQIPTNTNM